ncbi:MAG TPA: ornithine cyclodeaminase family domain [Candidatus Wunengus sp. YC65]|uniref:ornithine cyclodeaminase family domain n=1 Tax=Candidatus Wunengus sp. YC65 TaxID=3367701 RepID=UPI004028FCCC
MFDRNRLNLKSLHERIHGLTVDTIRPLEKVSSCREPFLDIAKGIVTAKETHKSVILMIGGHVVRSGVQRYIIDLMERGYISCLAMNGSVMIHDFEFALIGATTESVSKYIHEGQFGLWKETGWLNDIINNAYKQGKGMGEAVGEAIFKGEFPHKEISLMAAAYRLNIPVTVHVGIGFDIIHEHPNCSGAATGETSYRDFLRLASVLERLEGGVVMNFGSAVTAPEVFLKALSMARNVASRSGKYIRQFTTLVCDLHELPKDFSKEPHRDSSSYYFRPRKTMLIRTVADGGKSFYVKGKHSETIPALWNAINEVEKGTPN